jgi:uncharacterized protein|tara:strand:- start:954 stop:1247 length:294 start_codon:yes stop_codon:yes gene_type:complete
MKCPVDGTDLTMTERQGVEIDYCPKCRGIWLDRGELDKIIDRSAEDLMPEQPVRVAPNRDPRDGYGREGYRDDSRPYDPRYDKRKKKSSLLKELFDF